MLDPHKFQGSVELTVTKFQYKRLVKGKRKKTKKDVNIYGLSTLFYTSVFKLPLPQPVVRNTFFIVTGHIYVFTCTSI